MSLATFSSPFCQNLDEFVSIWALCGLSIVFGRFFQIFEVSVNFERICRLLSIILDYSRLLSITLDYPRLLSITLDYSFARSRLSFVSSSIVWWFLTISRLSCFCFCFPFLFFGWEAPQKECKWPRSALRIQNTSKSLQLSMFVCGESIFGSYWAVFSQRSMVIQPHSCKRTDETAAAAEENACSAKKNWVLGGAYVSKVANLSKCLRTHPACLNPTQKHLELLKVAQGLRLHCLKVFQNRSKSPNVATNLLENPLTTPTKNFKLGLHCRNLACFVHNRTNANGVCVLSRNPNPTSANEPTKQEMKPDALPNSFWLKQGLTEFHWQKRLVGNFAPWYLCFAGQSNPTLLNHHMKPCVLLITVEPVSAQQTNHVRELRNVKNDFALPLWRPTCKNVLCCRFSWFQWFLIFCCVCVHEFRETSRFSKTVVQ